MATKYQAYSVRQMEVCKKAVFNQNINELKNVTHV
jgi:hypothetical protein